MMAAGRMRLGQRDHRGRLELAGIGPTERTHLHLEYHLVRLRWIWVWHLLDAHIARAVIDGCFQELFSFLA
jgi:hypothetical protein